MSPEAPKALEIFENTFEIKYLEDGRAFILLKEKERALIYSGHYPIYVNDENKYNNDIEPLEKFGIYLFWLTDQKMNPFFWRASNFSENAFSDFLDKCEDSDASYYGVHSICGKPSFYSDHWIEYTILYNFDDLYNLIPGNQKSDLLRVYGKPTIERDSIEYVLNHYGMN